MSANDFRLGGFSPALESADHFKIKKSYDLFIGGGWVKASKQIVTTNPATGETLSKVGLAGKKEVNQAVRAARKSYDNVWSKMPAAERGKYLFRIARLIQERAREFAVVESMDGGKPIRESRDIGDFLGRWRNGFGFRLSISIHVRFRSLHGALG